MDGSYGRISFSVIWERYSTEYWLRKNDEEITSVFHPGNKFSDNSFMTSYSAIRYYKVSSFVNHSSHVFCMPFRPSL